MESKGNKRYVKPSIIAKSAAKQEFVASCPRWRGGLQYCTSLEIACMVQFLR